MSYSYRIRSPPKTILIFVDIICAKTVSMNDKLIKKLSKSKKHTEFNKGKGAPFFSNFFYSRPFLLFLPLNFYIFSYPHK